MTDRDDGFVAELKRRNMFRVAAGYIVCAWLALQVADVLFPAFGLPDSALRYVFGGLVVGFPLVLAFSWLFEVTPEGIKRESEIERDESIAPETGRRIERVTLAILAVAVAFFVVDRFVWSERATEPSGAPSIAVLPFADMSETGDQVWFSDGISEELLNLLSRIPELRVIGRTSSFQFKGQNLDLRTIADTLGVGSLLEGSVRRSGDALRVTAKLIDGGDGSELWSNQYDRTADDIFRVQEEIAAAVVEELRLELLGGEFERPLPANTQAHDLFLRGSYFADRRTPEDMRLALQLLSEAIDIDPDYAAARSKRASVYVNMGFLGTIQADSADVLSRTDIERALELDPTDPHILSRHAVTLGLIGWDWEEGQRLMQRALSLAPTDAVVTTNASILASAVGDVADAIRLASDAARWDPLNPLARGTLAYAYFVAGDFGRAEEAWLTALQYVPDNTFMWFRVSNVRMLAGDAEGALAAISPHASTFWGVAALPMIHHALGNERESTAAMTELIDRFGEANPLSVAEAYAYRGEVDEAFDWLERAYRDRITRVGYAKTNPLLANLSGDPRFDDLVARLGLE